MNPDLAKLQAYPFQRIAALKQGATPVSNKTLISLAIGEPQHAMPNFVLKTLLENLSTYQHYPLTKGHQDLRQSICDWLSQRFQLPKASLNPDQHVLPVNGTREALFAFAQCIIDRTHSKVSANKKAVVIMPNPFYQIYEGAALLADAEPYFMNCLEENGFLPDLDAVPKAVWQRCQLIYICTPGNPAGAVMPAEQLKQLLQLAEQYDFVIASDECYSEIYLNEDKPPVGLLQVAAQMGNTDYQRCIVFHSLSKRSNLPGLRSGFVAGDAAILRQFLLYRTYQGCALPMPTQLASITAWTDETHVQENRRLYQEKFTAVLKVLNRVFDIKKPEASFYLWPKLTMDDEQFTRELFIEQHLNVVPGRYLSRQANGINPGKHYVRLALVAKKEDCIEAAERICQFLEHRL